MALDDIDLVEINEAFASVVLAWQKETGADLAKVPQEGDADRLVFGGLADEQAIFESDGAGDGDGFGANADSARGRKTRDAGAISIDLELDRHRADRKTNDTHARCRVTRRQGAGAS